MAVFTTSYCEKLRKEKHHEDLSKSHSCIVADSSLERKKLNIVTAESEKIPSLLYLHLNFPYFQSINFYIYIVRVGLSTKHKK